MLRRQSARSFTTCPGIASARNARASSGTQPEKEEQTMKRCFVALLLFAAAAVAHAVTPANEDAGKIFQRLWDANQIHSGLNLILTYPNRQKLWADVKAENGYAVLNWVRTDAAGKTIPTVIIGKNGQRQTRILS